MPDASAQRFAIASCFASGVIVIGAVVPDGALPIASGPEGRLRKLMEVTSRHAWDGKTLLVPGVPEAVDQNGGIDALFAFGGWLARRQDPEITVMAVRKGGDARTMPVDISALPDVALSIRQPWCHRILWEGKDIENRTWSTRFRGPVLIHAGKTPEGAAYCRRIGAPLGGIVGVMEIVDCVTASESPWFQGPYPLARKYFSCSLAGRAEMLIFATA